MGVLLPKAKLGQFLDLIRSGASLVAPLKRKKDGVTAFEEVVVASDLDRLDLARIPQFTAKKYFMPATEELFSYDMESQVLTDRKLARTQRILFGMHLCDLNAVRIQDKFLLEGQFVDDHYKAARDAIALVGWYCNAPPSALCFCESMKLVNYYDLMLRELPDGNIYVDVGTQKGAKLLEKAKPLKLDEHQEAIPQIRTEKHLNTLDVRKHFDHPEWKRTTEEECVSCQRCTTMCPTCMCFDIYDSTQEDLRHGTRLRTWDSCHAIDFTRIAGGHVFRPDRTARFKHRVYHKLSYYPEVFGSPMCTGCGRCIEQCPSKIDFVEIINKMDAEQK